MAATGHRYSNFDVRMSMFECSHSLIILRSSFLTNSLISIHNSQFLNTMKPHCSSRASETIIAAFEISWWRFVAIARIGHHAIVASKGLAHCWLFVRVLNWLEWQLRY